MNQILPQEGRASHCLFPPQFLLSAGPYIAGLLPARVETASPISQIKVIKPRESLLDRQRAIWAAQDADIELFLEGARQRLAAVYAEVRQDAAHRSARPFIWEIAS